MDRMYSIAICAVCACLSVACTSQKGVLSTCVVEEEQMPVGEVSPTTLIIFYDAEIGKKPLLEEVEKSGAEIIYDYKNMNGMAIRKPSTMSLSEARKHFSGVRGVLSVEYDHVVHLD